MTCQEAEELLDLVAADACDPPTRDAVQSHLRQCDACAASYAESQRVQALLDLQLNKDSVERLQKRIEEAAQPRGKKLVFMPILRRASLVAAVLLLAVGLIWWLPRQPRETSPEFALLVRAAKLDVVPQAPAKLDFKDAEALILLQAVARAGNTLRNELMQAERDGKLPLPPAVRLELAVVNRGKRPVEVRLGDAEAKLSLDLAGDGVIRLAAPGAEIPETLRAQTLRLEPEKQLVLQMDRLVAGTPDKLEYIYLTEPGEFKLTPSLRLTADGKAMTVTGETVQIKVRNRPGDSP